LGQGDQGNLGTGELVNECGRGLGVKGGEHAEVAQRDAALQSARDYLVSDERRKHLLRLKVLVEMDVHGQAGALAEIKQRRKRAWRGGAGGETPAPQNGIGGGGAVGPPPRGRVSQRTSGPRE